MHGLWADGLWRSNFHSVGGNSHDTIESQRHTEKLAQKVLPVLHGKIKALTQAALSQSNTSNFHCNVPRSERPSSVPKYTEMKADG